MERMLGNSRRYGVRRNVAWRDSICRSIPVAQYHWLSSWMPIPAVRDAARLTTKEYARRASHSALRVLVLRIAYCELPRDSPEESGKD